MRSWNPRRAAFSTGERERFGEKIDGFDLRLGPFRREGNGDDARAGADVEHPGSLASRDGQLDQLLGFGAGNQGALVRDERATEKFRGSEQMLQRFARGAAGEPIPAGGSSSRSLKGRSNSR